METFANAKKGSISTVRPNCVNIAILWILTASNVHKLKLMVF